MRYWRACCTLGSHAAWLHCGCTPDLRQSGEDSRYLQAVVTLKHWDAYSLEDAGGGKGQPSRHNFDAKVRTLWDRLPLCLRARAAPIFVSAAVFGAGV